MKKFILSNLVMVFLIFLLTHPNSFAQQKDTLPNPALMLIQKLEDLTESNGDMEIDDDYFIQQMQQFIKDPINLNIATENDLSQLQLLTPLNIHSLLSYRSLLGQFIDIYELQAIPGWSVKLIERLRPYITVGSDLSTNYSYGDQFKKGQRSVIIRATRVLEKSKGYIPDTSKTNYYMGSPMKLFVRFKYTFKNVLQYGITAEKDAGEQFFKGTQRKGFDFYSAHFFARNIGLIKAIAIGDFAVNLGQGLIQWQSGLAARKGSDVLNIKRQEDVLRPYNSSGEINFQRGIGVTIKIKLFQATTFINYHKIDGNLVTDSIKKRIYISSLQTSGYHRTKSELNDKHSLQQFSIGGNVSYTNKNIHLGINGIHYSFGGDYFFFFHL